MDAKNIYVASQHMLGRVHWQQLKGNEWPYVGEGGDFKEAQVQARISEFFSDTELYLVQGRRDAFVVKTTEAAATIKEKLDGKDVTLVSKNFKNFFHFSYVGVARYGAVS